jgi:hypothetical protein
LLGSEVEHWDGDVLGLVDMDSYVGETAIATEDHNVDVEFKRDENDENPEDIANIKDKKSKQLVE